MPPKRGKGRGRGRGEEQGHPLGAGRGQARDVQRAQGVGEEEFIAAGQQARQPAEVPRQQPQRQVPPAHNGGTTEQFADASRREHIPQQPSKPTAEVVPLQVMESIAGLSLKAEAPRSSKKLQMAPRQLKGTLGRPIDLISNYFLLMFKDISVYHYDVEIVFLRQYRDKTEAASGLKPPCPKKGNSLLSEGRTAKKDAKKNVSHVEHQMKRDPGKQRCRQIIIEMCGRDRFRPYNPVYDGQKNMYTSKMLPMDPEQQSIKCKIELKEKGSVKEFEVTIKPVEKKGGGNLINLEPLRELYRQERSNVTSEIPQDVIMAFNTVMCHRSPPFSQVQVGRSFFLINDPHERKFHLGEGLEIWFGYNQSIHLTQKGPAVVVNFSAKVFHEAGHIIEVANQILSTDRNRVDITTLPRLNPQQIKKLESSFAEIKVEVIHQKYSRQYPVKGLTRTSARETHFKIDDNTEMSVAEYFQNTYGPLRYPNLPCLKMRTSKNTTYMPMEVCRILAGQSKLAKLSGSMTSNMIRKTAISVKDRFKKIWRNAQLIERMSGQIMSDFGLFLEPKFMELQGRVIEQPKLAYKPGDRGPVSADVDDRGTWKMDGKQFFRSKAEPCSWVLLSFSADRFCTMGHLQNFADTLCNCARSAGMNLEGPKDIRIFRSHEKTLEALKYAKKCDVAFAIVVLSSRDNYHSYEEVKFVAEIQLRLLTQCMNDLVVVKKCNSQVAGSVLLKINSKLGGVNHILSPRPVICSKPMIVFGADTAHSTRGYACPSVAAVVGSLDAFLFRYAATCRVQQNPDTKKLSQEIIIELEEMVKEILQAFLRNVRGKNPEKIVFFRDGVSEGQFNIVLENEIAAVQRACIAELNGFLPPLTFIVVQKGHQTRFRPRNPRDGVGRPGNVPPGTTVDTDVVHPKFFDFFLSSHEGIQGTSKPAHYTVLYDENKLSSDELQQLCYHLCHMYVRCNRSISVPAPVMYADLACTRAKKYADWYISEHPESVSSGSSVETRMLPEEMVNAISGMKNFEAGMFYV